MSILITLLVNLLMSFLAKIIENWLNSLLGKQSPIPPLELLYMHKADFLKQVSWRIWLGPNRKAKADQAFDLAMKNYVATKSAIDANYAYSAPSPTQIAQSLCDGLADQLK